MIIFTKLNLTLNSILAFAISNEPIGFAYHTHCSGNTKKLERRNYKKPFLTKHQIYKIFCNNA
ncbi:Uncharacterised protein [Klebsiella pneumoniae]|nr:Uncharacterised protein [Klebsiella pneumoniae]